MSSGFIILTILSVLNMETDCNLFRTEFKLKKKIAAKERKLE